MKKFIRLLFAMAGVFIIVVSILIFGASIALAVNPYINIPEQQRLSHEAWEHYWKSLSPRQKYLVKKIGEVETNYYTKHDRHIPVNQKNLYEVMRAVGARKSEADFVLSRMRVYIEFDNTIEETDKFIENIMKDPRIWGR